MSSRRARPGPTGRQPPRAASPALSAETLRAWFTTLVRHRQGEQRAPHKPLVLLDALARVSRGEPRLTRFGDVEAHLTTLLARFGRPGRSAHRPQYPFYRLSHDHAGQLWQLEPRLAENTAGDVPVPALRRASGGFTPPVHALLASDPALLHSLASALLAEFPASVSDSLLDAVGLHWQPLVERAPRTPAFRELVLRSYGRRCCVCHFDGRLGADDEFALEAAHILWHSYGGPDEVANGFALCVFHHKAFDRGAIAISDDHRVLVSDELNGSHTHRWLAEFGGQRIHLPSRDEERPRPQFLAWHRREVFRAPPRQVA